MTIAMILAGLCAVHVLMGWNKKKTTAFILSYRFDASVYRRLREAYPQLDTFGQEQLLDGLRDYFMVCREARGRFVSMPSKGVDEAWHAFVLSTRNYHAFCQRVFGRYLHHTPAETLVAGQEFLTKDGLRLAWQIACRLEGLDPRWAAQLPRLFALDERLGIAGGFIHGIKDWAEPLPAPRLMGAAGRRRRGNFIDRSGNGCGGDSGGGGGDSGGHGGHGCGGGGHGCGSGCGSGCGGGCGGGH